MVMGYKYDQFSEAPQCVKGSASSVHESRELFEAYFWEYGSRYVIAKTVRSRNRRNWQMSR